MSNTLINGSAFLFLENAYFSLFARVLSFFLGYMYYFCNIDCTMVSIIILMLIVVVNLYLTLL